MKTLGASGSPPSRPRAGFTLAEVAVTIVIVSATLLLVVQGLSNAKMTAAHAHNRKVARDLALVTLGQVEAGLYWEDFEVGDAELVGTYAEEGYEAFEYFLVTGREDIPTYEEDPEGYHDSYAYERWMREQEEDDDEDEDEETAEPYEIVTIRVTFPKLTDRENEITIERWIPWEQVYGPDEDAPEEDEP